MYDLIIIGAGPAGITAAIYAMRKRMNTLVLAGEVGGQALWISTIENYTGFEPVSGLELVKRFREHLERLPVELHEGEKATSARREGSDIIVVTPRGEYRTKTLIVASGKTSRKLQVPGEDRLAGKGIAYCATCDAPLFVDKDVAVVGSGNSGLDAALQLTNIARFVHIIDRRSSSRGDPVLIEKVMLSGGVRFHGETTVKEVTGGDFVDGVVIEEKGVTHTLPVEGVFVQIGWAPSSDFIHDVAKDARGQVLINCGCETDRPGIFAAGDVTNVPAKQVLVAAGEGAKAAVAAFNYLIRLAPEIEQKAFMSS